MYGFLKCKHLRVKQKTVETFYIYIQLNFTILPSFVLCKSDHISYLNVLQLLHSTKSVNKNGFTCQPVMFIVYNINWSHQWIKIDKDTPVLSLMTGCICGIVRWSPLRNKQPLTFCWIPFCTEK